MRKYGDGYTINCYNSCAYGWVQCLPGQKSRLVRFYEERASIREDCSEAERMIYAADDLLKESKRLQREGIALLRKTERRDDNLPSFLAKEYKDDEIERAKNDFDSGIYNPYGEMDHVSKSIPSVTPTKLNAMHPMFCGVWKQPS